MTRPPTAVTAAGVGCARRRAASSTTGSSRPRNPSVRPDPAGRSTTSTSSASRRRSAGDARDVRPRPRGGARSSPTTAAASSRPTCGPGRRTAAAVRAANSQSTRSSTGARSLEASVVSWSSSAAMRPPYVARAAPPSPGRTQRHPHPARAAARSSSAVRAARRTATWSARITNPAAGRRRPPTVPVRLLTPGEGARLRPDHPQPRLLVRPGEAVASVPEAPATGSPDSSGRSSGWAAEAASTSSCASAAGGHGVARPEPAAAREVGAGDGAPSRATRSRTATPASANVPWRPARAATTFARASATVLSLSVRACSTRSPTGADETRASVRRVGRLRPGDRARDPDAVPAEELGESCAAAERRVGATRGRLARG